ncbi:hypothetical protein YC2023_009464 [Brassica napus]
MPIWVPSFCTPTHPLHPNNTQTSILTDEPVIGEFHQDPDSDSSGDDDSETDYH